MAKYILIANTKRGHKDNLFEVHSLGAETEDEAVKEGQECLNFLRRGAIRRSSAIDEFHNFRVVKVVETIL